MTNLRLALSTMLSAGLFAVILVAPSFAHHTVAAVFDLSKPMSLKGTITNMEWRNPHSSIYLDVRDAAGKITNWWVEMPAIANLAKAGLDKDLIDLTQTYSMEVFVAKDGSTKAVAITMTFPDSKSYDLREKP